MSSVDMLMTLQHIRLLLGWSTVASDIHDEEYSIHT